MPGQGLSNLTIREETSKKLRRLLKQYNEENKTDISLAEFFVRLTDTLEKNRIGEVINEELFRERYRITLLALIEFNDCIEGYAKDFDKTKEGFDRVVSPYLKGEMVKEETIGGLTTTRELPVPTQIGELYLLLMKAYESFKNLIISEVRLESILQAPFERLFPRSFKSLRDDHSKEKEKKDIPREIKKKLGELLTGEFEVTMMLPSSKELQKHADSFVNCLNEMLTLFKEDPDVQKIGAASRYFLAEIQKSLDEMAKIEEQMANIWKKNTQHASSSLFSSFPSQEKENTTPGDSNPSAPS